MTDNPVTTLSTARSSSWSDFRIVNEYPHPPEKVWRALTDPALVPLWTKEGLGGRPEGFSLAVGAKFKFVTDGWQFEYDLGAEKLAKLGKATAPPAITPPAVPNPP